MHDSSRASFHFRDLIVLLFIALLVPAATARFAVQQRETSNRIKCASNLQRIGLCIQIYANENRGGFPRVRWDASGDPVPTQYTGVNASNPFASDGPALNDVSAALYLAVRSGDIEPGDFICPSAAGVFFSRPFAPPPGKTVQSFSNFAGRHNLSYGYTNPYPSSTARMLGFKLNFTLSSDFAIGADMGPGPSAAQVPANATRDRIRTANSRNHDGDGQNVLFADGHVDWMPTTFCGAPRPVAGAPRDNVYAFGADTTLTAPSAGTRGAPKDQYDSVILPTTDIDGPSPPRPSSQPAAGASSTGTPADDEGADGNFVVWAIAFAAIGAGVAVAVMWFLRKSNKAGQYPPPPAAPAA